VASPDLSAIERRMDGAVEALRKDLVGLRTGRANPQLLEPIVVEAYGTSMPLTQVGTIGAPEARLLTVQVWDRGMVKAVEKSIRDAGLGLNPQSDGQTVRVPLPELNEERRRELTKIAHKYAEAARVAVRNVRRDGMDALKKAEKDGDVSQDEHKTQSDKVQAMTDRHIKAIDDTLAQKEREILQI
jgi:ribosome recycling factor